jgi:hypothetical protein
VLPLGREEADALWRRSDRRLSEQDVGNERILPGSPLEPILRQLRRDASAQPSREGSAAPTQTEPSASDDEDQQVAEELLRRQREAQEEVEGEEIDGDTDTEHETPERIRPEIVERMNALKDLLLTEETGERGRDQKLERLENLLERFKENEIPIEQCAEGTLQDPLLLLLA